jgi:hypothetical protein
MSTANTTTNDTPEARYRAMVADLAAERDVPLTELLEVLAATRRAPEQLTRDVDALAEADDADSVR